MVYNGTKGSRELLQRWGEAGRKMVKVNHMNRFETEFDSIRFMVVMMKVEKKNPTVNARTTSLLTFFCVVKREDMHTHTTYYAYTTTNIVYIMCGVDEVPDLMVRS